MTGDETGKAGEGTFTSIRLMALWRQFNFLASGRLLKVSSPPGTREAITFEPSYRVNWSLISSLCWFRMKSFQEHRRPWGQWPLVKTPLLFLFLSDDTGNGHYVKTRREGVKMLRTKYDVKKRHIGKKYHKRKKAAHLFIRQYKDFLFV